MNSSVAKTMATKRKKLLFVTSGRSDLATIESLLSLCRKDQSMNVFLFVTGDHTRKETGETYRNIQTRGIRIIVHSVSGTSSSIASSVTISLGKFLRSQSIDAVVLCGDRKEMLAAGVAATLERVPIIHIHGGDVSYGMPDDAIRHALTKLSTIHFVASPLSARRVKQMGEEAWRVHMTGSPDLDGLRELHVRAVSRLKRFKHKFAMLLLNPESAGEKENRAMARSIVAALKSSYTHPVIVLYPNNDAGSKGIRDEYASLSKEHFLRFRSLPRDEYTELLRRADFLIGNSSSGIIEAATLKTPVINVGSRQDGRERNRNVVDVRAKVSDIKRAIKKVSARAFRSSLKGRNVYGDGKASARIYNILKKMLKKYDKKTLLYKRFTRV